MIRWSREGFADAALRTEQHGHDPRNASSHMKVTKSRLFPRASEGGQAVILDFRPEKLI